MRCKKTIVMSVANCQVNWHSYADLKVSQQESESKSEIESSSVIMVKYDANLVSQ